MVCVCVWGGARVFVRACMCVVLDSRCKGACALQHECASVCAAGKMCVQCFPVCVFNTVFFSSVI